jgi:hypothetical protein
MHDYKLHQVLKEMDLAREKVGGLARVVPD